MRRFPVLFVPLLGACGTTHPPPAAAPPTNPPLEATGSDAGAAFELHTLFAASPRPVRTAEVLRPGVVVLEDDSDTRRAYTVDDGRATNDLRTLAIQQLDQRDAALDRVNTELDPGATAADWNVAQDRLVLQSFEQSALEGTNAHVVIRLRAFRWSDLAPTEQVSFETQFPPSDDLDGRLSLSPQGRFAVVEVGRGTFEENYLVEVPSLRLVRHDPNQLSSTYWARDDRRMIVSRGCFCEGQDGTSITILDVDRNREIFALANGPLHLGPSHEGLRWTDDRFWLVEAHQIRIWDMSSGALLWTAPLDPALVDSPLGDGFTHNAESSSRIETSGGIVYPAIAWVPDRDEAVVARADGAGVLVSRLTRDGSRHDWRTELAGVVWMAFTQGQLVLLTEEGGLYTISQPTTAPTHPSR